MIKEILWDKDIGKTLVDFSYDDIDAFLEALILGNKQDAAMYVNDWVNQDNCFWEWLYAKDNSDLNDVKKEIQIWLGRSVFVDEKAFDEKEKSIGLNVDVKVLLAGAYRDGFGFFTVDEYLQGLRAYLAMEKKSDFVEDMQECFPNLVFVCNIGTTINTLNRNFDELRNEIVEHLSKLDGYRNMFKRMSDEGKAYSEMAEAFKRDTGIDCSTQASRSSTKGLRLLLFNAVTQRSEEINCELHTKFNKFNIDRTKQDRIYFFPGREGILDGKIVVKHIGTHL